jgi:hypothetical protein
MQPVSPVLTEEFQPLEVVFGGKNQPEYAQLPAMLSSNHLMIVHRWVLTPEERRAIANGASLFISQMVFGQLPQPIRPEIMLDNRQVVALAQELGLVNPPTTDKSEVEV